MSYTPDTDVEVLEAVVYILESGRLFPELRTVLMKAAIRALERQGLYRDS